MDGTDRCSRGEDIIFKFVGFTVMGKVTDSLVSAHEQVLASEGGSGLANATVSLSSRTGSLPLCGQLRIADVSLPARSTTTATDGTYAFAAVVPGPYRVDVAMPRVAFSTVFLL